LRLVAVAAGDVETQGRAILSVNVDNHGRRIEFSATPEAAGLRSGEPAAGKAKPTVAAAAEGNPCWDESLLLAAKAPGMSEIIFVHNGRILGRADGEEARVTINPRVLGTGPVTLQAFGLTRGESSASVRSRPIELTIDANRPLPAWRLPRGATLVRGLQLRLASGKTIPIQETLSPNWLTAAGAKAGEAIELEGIFDVAKIDTYQFQLWHDGELKLAVDGRTLYEGKPTRGRERFVPVALAEGLHRLKVAGVAGPDARLLILFGGPGTLSLDGARFRHTNH
jgi:hypothetical protein